MASTLGDVIVDVEPSLQYQQYSIPQPPLIPPVTINQNVTIVNQINGGGGGHASGNVTFTSSWSGVQFVASGSQVTLSITNAANARAAIGAAASGINNDISQLNGASQVNVSGEYKVGGTQVVGSQQPAIPDATGGATVDVEARAALNQLLAELRTHGLIHT